MKFSPIILASIILFLLSSCSGDKEKEKEKEKNKVTEMKLDQAYNEAMKNLNEKSYKTAAENFEKIEEEQPYSIWASQAQVMAAYAHYRNDKYDDAIAVIDRFIKLHPGHKSIAYMYYLKALCYYDQISDVKRDQKTSEYALASLREVGARFPDTTYARDAKVKIDLVNDHLAGKEMEIGRFYLSKGKTIAALNRFQTVVERYQTTTHVPEALYRLTAAYMLLGVRDEATKYAAVLGHNYPASKWYKYSYDLMKGNKGATTSAETSLFSKWWKKN